MASDLVTPSTEQHQILLKQKVKPEEMHGMVNEAVSREGAYDWYNTFPEGPKNSSQMTRSWQGVIHVDFLPRNVTITAQYYSNLLHSDV
jgi:hypothetical protein